MRRLHGYMPALALVSLVAAGGCASRGDVEALRAEMAGLRSSMAAADARAAAAEAEAQRAAATAQAAADARARNSAAADAVYRRSLRK